MAISIMRTSGQCFLNRRRAGAIIAGTIPKGRASRWGTRAGAGLAPALVMIACTLGIPRPGNGMHVVPEQQVAGTQHEKERCCPARCIGKGLWYLRFARERYEEHFA